MENIVKDIERIIKETITTKEIDGKVYSNQNLHIVRHRDYACEKTFNDLSSLVSMIKHELNIFNPNLPLYVNVESPKKVTVFTSLDENKERETPYSASYIEDKFSFNTSYRHEDFVIALRSQFVQNEDSAEMLELLKKVTNAQSIEVEDDGITQRIISNQGASLSKTVQPVPIRRLAPFRTFIEVEQPTSEFLFRMKDSGNFALYEADGGAWKKKAKENIKNYFKEELAEEIEKGTVVIVS